MPFPRSHAWRDSFEAREFRLVRSGKPVLDQAILQPGPCDTDHGFEPAVVMRRHIIEIAYVSRMRALERVRFMTPPADRFAPFQLSLDDLPKKNWTEALRELYGRTMIKHEIEPLTDAAPQFDATLWRL